MGAEDPGPKRRRLAGLLAVGVPLVAAGVLALLMRPEVNSLLAPLFGPWAGWLYGHSDCTLGNQAPGAAGGMVLLGIGALVGLVRVQTGVWHLLTVVVACTWTVGWELSALASIANTLS